MSVHAVTNLYFFFFNDTATTEIYTLSLHDALPILVAATTLALLFTLGQPALWQLCAVATAIGCAWATDFSTRRALIARSEEHTSELQSRQYLVCRLLLEKKKKIAKGLRSYAENDSH